MAQEINATIRGKQSNVPYEKKTVVLGGNMVGERNILTQDMLLSEDTKYIIRWAFDLDAKTVIMPAGSSLEFNGGSINNGTIVLNDTPVYPSYNMLTSGSHLTIEGNPSVGTYNYTDGMPIWWNGSEWKRGTDLTQVQSDWNQTDVTKPDYIKNKPTIPEEVTVDTALSKTSTNPVQNKAVTKALEESGNIDKSYDKAKYSGLGRKILRKNMVNGVNTLTQSMINQSNTIYVIQYDFTLASDITIPANCVLEFDGGSISGNYRMVSNDTKVIGDYLDSFSSFSGAVYDRIGNILHINGKPIEKCDYHKLYGVRFVKHLEPNGTGSADGMQCMCMTRTHIFISSSRPDGAIDSADGSLLIYDRNFTYLGQVLTPNTYHSNSCTTDGEKIYIAGVNENTAYSKIVTFNISDALSNIGGSVPTEEISVGSGYMQDCISYDPDTEIFAISENYIIKLYDKNFSLIKSGNTKITDKFSEIFGYTTLPQSAIYVNGLVYIFWSKMDSKDWRGNSYCAIYDVEHDKIVKIIDVDSSCNNDEIEGACVDPVTQLIFAPLVYFGNHTIGAISFNTKEDEILSTTYKARSNGDVDYLPSIDCYNMRDCYVDNTFTGVSAGNASYPYKSIEEALIRSNFGNHLDIHVKSTGKVYNVDVELCNRDISIVCDDSNPAELFGIIICHNSTIKLSNVLVHATHSTFLNVKEHSYINLSNVKVRLENNNVPYFVYCYSSTIIAKGCEITGVGNESETAGRKEWINRIAFGIFESSKLTILSTRFSNVMAVYANKNSGESAIYINHKDCVFSNTTIEYVDCPNPIITYDICSDLNALQDLFDRIIPYTGYYSSKVEIGSDIVLDNNAKILSGVYLIGGGAISPYDRNRIYSPTIGMSGPATALPAKAIKGQPYFDETNNRPLWWNGTNWVDATGATIQN